MQTFLPYANFAESAACLDRQRLGKQRLETLQVMKCLAGIPSSWRNHPCVKMWRGYEHALLTYQDAICYEWTEVRGYADAAAGNVACLTQTAELITEETIDNGDPFWLHLEEFHISHQSALVRKDPEWYRKFFPDVADDLPYVWPLSNAQLVP